MVRATSARAEPEKIMLECYRRLPLPRLSFLFVLLGGE